MVGIASVGALGAGLVMGRVITGRGSVLAPVEFRGTTDDARSLLTTISSTVVTVVTVIALVLGLTVVALQLAQRSSRRGCCGTFCGADRSGWC